MFSIEKATLADCPLIQTLASNIWEPTYGSILSREQLDYMFEMMYSNESLQKQMQEMQLLSLKYQQEAGKGEDADSAKIEDLQKQYSALYEEIMKNENMEAYSAAASQMEEMAQYISKMIGLFFDGQDPETCEIPDESCTHNCSTCGGCH